MSLTKDELKSKSENLILLYEFLYSQETTKGGYNKFDRKPKINDKELRELMSQSIVGSVNINSIFTNQ
jgi:hypothetical protein